MFFKKLRSRSKSSSHSTKPSITRMASMSSSTHNGTVSSITKHNGAIVSPPVVTPLSTVGEYTNTNKVREEKRRDEEDAGSRDYEEFLEKARKDAEKAEKDRLKQIKKARETNLSPWASRM